MRSFLDPAVGFGFFCDEIVEFEQKFAEYIGMRYALSVTQRLCPRRGPSMNPKIAEHHRSKPAYIYLRQSTPGQVRHHHARPRRRPSNRDHGEHRTRLRLKGTKHVRYLRKNQHLLPGRSSPVGCMLTAAQK
jgi:hypothetical protein